MARTVSVRVGSKPMRVDLTMAGGRPLTAGLRLRLAGDGDGWTAIIGRGDDPVALVTGDGPTPQEAVEDAADELVELGLMINECVTNYHLEGLRADP